MRLLMTSIESSHILYHVATSTSLQEAALPIKSYSPELMAAGLNQRAPRVV